MTLPVDLVLVRHGESLINEANRQSPEDDNGKFGDKVPHLHTSSVPLSDKGWEQVRKARDYFEKEFTQKGTLFDRFVTSEFVRALQTAGGLGLPGASWYTEPYLVERDWGKLDMRSRTEREIKFMEEMRRRHAEPYFWIPPDGESLKLSSLYVDRVFDTLHRAESKKPAILVCHGETMWAVRFRLERLSQITFREMIFAKGHAHTIFNCQIFHYTRRDPVSGTIGPYVNWVRWIRPTDTPPTTSGWQKIVRPRYSNEELLALADNIVRAKNKPRVET